MDVLAKKTLLLCGCARPPSVGAILQPDQDVGSPGAGRRWHPNQVKTKQNKMLNSHPS